MSQPHDDYKRLEPSPGVSMHECPVCGAAAELWQYSTSESSVTNKVVMCSRGDEFGPQAGSMDAGCLLFMPSQGFYRATAREAIRYWNDYAAALMKIQRATRWESHRAGVLRAPSGTACEEPPQLTCKRDAPEACWNVRCNLAKACVREAE